MNMLPNNIRIGLKNILNFLFRFPNNYYKFISVKFNGRLQTTKVLDAGIERIVELCAADAVRGQVLSAVSQVFGHGGEVAGGGVGGLVG